MSNTCCSDYCFVSKNKEQIEKLHNTIKQLFEPTAEERAYYSKQEKYIPALNNEYRHLCSLCEKVGFQPSGDLRSDLYECDEILSTISNDEGDTYFFYLNCEDAWCAKDDVYAAMLRAKFPDVTVYVRADEGGCDVYTNTDPTGMFFPQQYRLDVCLPGKGDGDGYFYEDFDSESDCLEYLAAKLDIHADSVTQANKIIEMLVNQDSSGNAFGSIHMYTGN